MVVDILGNEAIHAAIERERQKDELVAGVVESLIRSKSWEDMGVVEHRACLRFIVPQVEGEDELRERLTKLRVKDFQINWHLSEPGDQTGQEARMLVRALGGLVAKNGALVSIMTPDEQF